jgi:hydroxymethylglutaryl-CoA synthase
LGDKDVEKLSMRAASELYKSKTLPTVLLGTEVGNMYTASLYGGLVSLIVNKELSELGGRRVVMFSYGSGLASALYSLRISSDISLGSALGRIWSVLRGVPDRLRDRKTVPPVEFERIMKLREGTHHKPSYTPTGDVDDLYPGTFYLTHVDEKFRRSYERTTPMPHPPSPPLVPPIRLNN